MARATVGAPAAQRRAVSRTGVVWLSDWSFDSSGLAQLLSLDPCGGGAPCTRGQTQTAATAFERTSKRRSGFPSETKVKRGRQIVHGEKELEEKLGRNDLCPCGSSRRFQELLHAEWEVRRFQTRLLLLGSSRR